MTISIKSYVLRCILMRVKLELCFAGEGLNLEHIDVK